jgi:plasmid maintenance system antidote protein VapI
VRRDDNAFDERYSTGLPRYFGNSAKFWLGLQVDFDIGEEEKAKIW